MDTDCVLCQKYPSRIFESKYFFAIYDDFPVRQGHLLLVPIRHMEHLTDLSCVDFCDFSRLLREMAKHLEINFGTDDYNFGVNSGEAAG